MPEVHILFVFFPCIILTAFDSSKGMYRDDETRVVHVILVLISLICCKFQVADVHLQVQAERAPTTANS